MGLVRVCLIWIWFLTDIDFLHKAKQQLLNALPLEGDVTVWMNEATNVIIKYCLFKSLRRFGAGIIKFCVWYLSPVVVSAVQACVQTPFRRLSWNTRCQLFLHNLLTTAYELTPVPLLRAQLNVRLVSNLFWQLLMKITFHSQAVKTVMKCPVKNFRLSVNRIHCTHSEYPI